MAYSLRAVGLVSPLAVWRNGHGPTGGSYSPSESYGSYSPSESYGSYSPSESYGSYSPSESSCGSYSPSESSCGSEGSSSASHASADDLSGWWAEARAAGSTRRALLFALNYAGTSSALSGCINDAHNIASMLRGRGYTDDDIVIVTDAGMHGAHGGTAVATTRTGVVLALRRLAAESHLDTVTECWQTYSGHGTSIPDDGHSESDGNDEGMVLDDGALRDDVHHDILLEFGAVRLMIVHDMCHSGTSVDLPHRWSMSRSRTQRREEAGHWERSMQAQVTMLSGSRDDQVSMDLELEGTHQGAVTHALLRVLREADYGIAFSTLMRRVLRWLKDKKLDQRPQLTSTHRLRRGTPFFADGQLARIA